MESIQLKENVMDSINAQMVTGIQTNIVQKVFSLMDKFATGQKMLTVTTHLQNQNNQLNQNNLSNQRSRLNQRNQVSISINALLIVKKKLPCLNGGHAMPTVVLSQTIKKQPQLLLLPPQPKLQKIITSMDSGN